MNKATPSSKQTPFWERPLAELDRGQWEALCDGCGRCCVHKLEDEETGVLYPTNVACKLLDRRNGRCTDYKHRKAFVPDCLRLTPKLVNQVAWLPPTCAYRVRADGKPLPEWHYLLTGSRESMIRAGVSVVGRVISEDDAGPLEHHIVEWTKG